MKKNNLPKDFFFSGTYLRQRWRARFSKFRHQNDQNVHLKQVFFLNFSLGGEKQASEELADAEESDGDDSVDSDESEDVSAAYEDYEFGPQDYAKIVQENFQKIFYITIRMS